LWQQEERPGALEYRFRLATEFQRAVYAINSAGYVHKNICPDNLFTFDKRPATEQTDPTEIRLRDLSSVYSMDWRMLPKGNTSSNHFGDKEWTKNFYCYEERQGTEPQQRYAIKHDIYSLGICLLEIGLWESLIVEMDGSFELIDCFLAAAAELEGYPEST